MGFKFITEKLMGHLRPTHFRALKRISKRREALIAELDALEDQRNEVVSKTVIHLKIDTLGPFRGLHITDEGTVHAMYCPCPTCQATLNNTTALEAVEHMIKDGHIPADSAQEMRDRAKDCDKQSDQELVN